MRGRIDRVDTGLAASLVKIVRLRAAVEREGLLANSLKLSHYTFRFRPRQPTTRADITPLHTHFLQAARLATGTGAERRDLGNLTHAHHSARSDLITLVGRPQHIIANTAFQRQKLVGRHPPRATDLGRACGEYNLQ